MVLSATPRNLKFMSSMLKEIYERSVSIVVHLDVLSGSTRTFPRANGDGLSGLTLVRNGYELKGKQLTLEKWATQVEPDTSQYFDTWVEFHAAEFPANTTITPSATPVPGTALTSTSHPDHIEPGPEPTPVSAEAAALAEAETALAEDP